MELTEMLREENPCTVFPNEIWDQILDKMQDTDYIVALFKVFPQLTGLTKGKEFSWLIGEVMPLIMPKYLFRHADILNCRLVSKKWRNAIGTTLETHPERLPYKSSSLSKVNENHFCYSSLPRTETNVSKILQSDFANIPQHRANDVDNPFLGRYLKIKICVPEERRTASEVLMSNVLSLLEDYGHHVHHIYFSLTGREKFEEEILIRDFLSEILRCLSYLPNLKSFKLGGSGLKRFMKNVGESTINLNSESVPLLPKLETVDLTVFTGVSVQTYHQVLKALVKHDRVKKLGVHYAYWDKKFGSLFPALTELMLFQDNRESESVMEELGQVLQHLDAPHLRKLLLNNRYNIFEILQVIRPYKIESLELVGYFPGDKNETGTEIMAPSIKDLKMRVYINQSYQFLQSLPSLQDLYLLHDHEESDGYDESDDDEDCYKKNADPIKLVKEDWRNLGHFLVGTRTHLSRLDFLWNRMSQLKFLTAHAYGSVSQVARESKNKIFKGSDRNWYVPVPNIFRHRHE